MADNPYERDNPTSSPASDDPPQDTAPPVSPEPPADVPQYTATTPLPATSAPGAGEDYSAAGTFDQHERPGQHQAQRPVPRSGLTEHNSAGYLTGELSPPQTAADPAHTGPQYYDGQAPTGPEHTATWQSEAPRPGPESSGLLEGATAEPRLPSRAGAHVWTVLLTLLLAPVAWYLLADAGARLTQPAGNPWETTNLNIAALLELVGGLLVLTVILLAARWSSLGAIVIGSIVLVLGVPFLAVPAWTQDVLVPITDWLRTLGDFGANTAAHLVATGSTGRLIVCGLVLIFLGVATHGARRRGRREVRAALTA